MKKYILPLYSLIFLQLTGTVSAQPASVRQIPLTIKGSIGTYGEAYSIRGREAPDVRKIRGGYISVRL